jgi:hypothetical protein
MSKTIPQILARILELKEKIASAERAYSRTESWESSIAEEYERTGETPFLVAQAYECMKQRLQIKLAIDLCNIEIEQLTSRMIEIEIEQMIS